MPLQKLLVITPWYPNRLNPNDGNFVRNATALVAGDFRVTVLCIIEDTSLEAGRREVVTRTEDEIEVHRVYYAGAGARVQRIFARRKAWLAGARLLAKDYDLIHAHVLIDGGIFAGELSRRFKVPFVVSEHASRWLLPWPAGRIPERMLAVRAARKAVAILPVSAALASSMAKYKITDNVEVVPNPVDERLFFPPRDVRTTGPFTFLHVSDFTPNKRIDLILPAFFEMWTKKKDSRLVISGDGDLNLVAGLIEAKWAIVKESHPELPANPPIEFSGPHGPAEVARLMRGADAFVLASDVETQSVVLLEAQLCGLPCISTRSGGPDTIINTQAAGYLVAPDNKDELSTAMLNMTERGRPGSEARASIAAAARGNYGNTAVRDQLLKIYESALHA